MTTEEMQEIITRVLSRAAEWDNPVSTELPLEFLIETSARHVHLTEAAVEQLFGEGARLTPKSSLSQPGQYLCEERVALVTRRGRIDNVAVLGPPRTAIQTELSAGDCVQLGIKAPVRLSGDLTGAGDVYIVGPRGMLDARGSVIIAKAHIHITPEEAAGIGIRDRQRVSVRIPGKRQVTIGDVICRVSSSAKLAMHIDFDEANACMVEKGAKGKMCLNNDTWPQAVVAAPSAGAAPMAGPSSGKKSADVRPEEEGMALGALLKGGRVLITERDAVRLAEEGHKTIPLSAGMILTPSARDVLRSAAIKVELSSGGCERC